MIHHVTIVIYFFIIQNKNKNQIKKNVLFLSSIVHTGVEVRRMDSEMSRLVE